MRHRPWAALYATGRYAEEGRRSASRAARTGVPLEGRPRDGRRESVSSWRRRGTRRRAHRDSQRTSHTSVQACGQEAPHTSTLRDGLPTRSPRVAESDLTSCSRSEKVAVFVDPCFWHVCPEHGRQPTSNEWYWTPKLRRNVECDREQTSLLLAQGWTVIRVWEHEPLELAATRVSAALQAAKSTRLQGQPQRTV